MLSPFENESLYRQRLGDAAAGLRYWLFFLPIFGVVGPLYIIWQDFENKYLITNYNLFDQVPFALIIFFAGLLCTAIGFFVLPNVKVIHGAPTNTNLPFYLWIFTFLVIVIVMSGGSPNRFFSTVQALSSKVIGSTDNQTTIFALLPVLGLLSFLNVVTLTTASDKKSIFRAIVPVVLTAILCFSVGSRARATSAILAPMIFYAGRPNVRWLNLIPVLVGVIAIAAIGDYVRRQAQGVMEVSSESPIVLFIGSFSIIDSIAVAVAMSQESPKTMSAALWNIVQWILPKSIVGTKDLTAAVLARYLLEGDTLGGITLSSYGEIYFYFGLLGVLVGGLSIGWLLRSYLQMASGGGVSGVIAFYVAYNYIFVTNRNGVINDLPDFLTLNIILLTVILFQSMRQKNGS